jgi:hypothetical protein
MSITKQLGMVGLGRMGANMVRRLMGDGHECVVYDVNEDPIAELEGEGATGARSLEEMVQKLEAPRSIWIMVPAAYVEGTLEKLVPLLDEDDTIIDGGNSWYHLDVDRSKELTPKGIHYLDVGTSGRARPQTRLLPDDWWEHKCRWPSRSYLRHAGPWPRQRATNTWARGRRQPRRTRLVALRAQRFGPLRQDGAQRHRVRPDGGLR